jgi:hypothetical protein
MGRGVRFAVASEQPAALPSVPPTDRHPAILWPAKTTSYTYAKTPRFRPQLRVVPMYKPFLPSRVGISVAISGIQSISGNPLRSSARCVDPGAVCRTLENVARRLNIGVSELLPAAPSSGRVGRMAPMVSPGSRAASPTRLSDCSRRSTAAARGRSTVVWILQVITPSMRSERTSCRLDMPLLHRCCQAQMSTSSSWKPPIEEL